MNDTTSPEWPVPNYNDPATLRTPIDAVCYATTALMLVFVCARVYVRLHQSIGMDKDDWLMIVAAVLASSMSAIILIATRSVAGRHIYDVEQELLPIWVKLNLAIITIFNVTNTLTKISLCLTYLRFFPSRGRNIFNRIMIAYQLIWCIVTTVMYFIQCLPFDSLWNFSVPKSQCLDLKTLVLATTITNAVSDVLVFLWPIIPLCQVQISLSQHLSLILLFGSGMVACSSSVIRILFSLEYISSTDSTWIAGKLLILLTIEYNIGIICACSPCLRPLLAMLLPNLFVFSTDVRVQHSLRNMNSVKHKHQQRNHNQNHQRRKSILFFLRKDHQIPSSCTASTMNLHTTEKPHTDSEMFAFADFFEEAEMKQLQTVASVAKNGFVRRERARTATTTGMGVGVGLEREREGDRYRDVDVDIENLAAQWEQVRSAKRAVVLGGGHRRGESRIATEVEGEDWM